MKGRDAKPYTETWLSVARIGPRDPALVGAELFNAHTAYVAALAAVNAGTGSKQMYADAANALGELLTLVCTDKALDPFLADYLHDNCPAYTPESADTFLDQWEQWRRRRSRPAVPAAVSVERPRPRPIEPPRVAPTPPPAVPPAEPATDRDAIIRELFYEGLTQREIAARVGTSRANVRKRLDKQGLSYE